MFDQTEPHEVIQTLNSFFREFEVLKIQCSKSFMKISKLIKITFLNLFEH